MNHPTDPKIGDIYQVKFRADYREFNTGEVYPLEVGDKLIISRLHERKYNGRYAIFSLWGNREFAARYELPKEQGVTMANISWLWMHLEKLNE